MHACMIVHLDVILRIGEVLAYLLIEADQLLGRLLQWFYLRILLSYLNR